MADIIGTAGDDQGDNALVGTIGDDTYFGLGGDDWLVASFGNDTLDGGEGVDVVSTMALLYQPEFSSIIRLQFKTASLHIRSKLLGMAPNR